MTENLEKEQKQASQDIENNPQWNGAINEEIYTAEQRKRHLEQLEWSKQEVAKKESLLIETYKKMAEQDASVLDDLFNKEPKMTDRIAQEFGYEDYNDLKNTMSSSNSSNENKWFTEDDFEEWYNKRRSKEVHSEALKEWEKIINKLPEELQEKARKYFDDIVDWKKLTIEQAKNFADMSVLYVSKDKIKDDKYANVIAEAMSTWIWKWKSKKSNEVSKETLDFARDLWLEKYFE